MNIGIIGLGLMGGSFARVLKKHGHTVYAYDLSESVMRKGELMKAYDHPLTVEVADRVDMLVAAVFPSSFGSAIEDYLPHLKSGAIVTDFCGTKGRVVEEMKAFSVKFPELVFVGGHPMAGREYSGIEHSAINLFDKASMILVPVVADIYALDAMKKFFLSLGFGSVVFTTARDHDETIAYTSQLCHIVSNAYVKNKCAERHYGFSAGSYKDLTRVARLDPEMWAGLMTENREELSSELAELIGNLNEYLSALRSGDESALRSLLAEGNERKIAIDGKNKS